MKIHTESLSDQFANLILEMIMNKSLLPGEQIPTKELAENSNVSVMPVRLALRELTQKRVVVNRARVGFFVADYSKEELLQISGIRRMFQMYCMDNFFDQMDLAILHKLYSSIESNVGDNFNNLQAQKDDSSLHATIVKASHNEFLIEEYENLHYLFDYFISYDDEKTGLISSREQHLQILNYIFNGDKKNALHVLNLHLNQADQAIEIIGKSSNQ